MKRGQAAATVFALAACTAGFLWAPWWLLATASVTALAAMRRGRLPFAAFTASTVAVNALLFAILVPNGAAWRWQGVALDTAAWTGVVAGLRLSAMVGLNLAVLSWLAPSRLLDGLRLPRRATALLGAVVIAAHDVGRDARRLWDARRLEAGWPRRRMARLRTVGALLPALVVAAVRRAEVRRDALLLAGHPTGPRFVPLVAITALAIAGRLALLALPNVALTYVVVFAGGLLFGARAAVLAGLLAMTLTDLMLTGLLPSAFANALAMAALGGLGALLGRVRFGGTDRTDRVAGMVLAAAVGILATLLFSVVADAATWLVVPEFRAHGEILAGRIILGLAFNVVPALANAVLFAACVGPLQDAMRALGWSGSGAGSAGAAGRPAAKPLGPGSAVK